MALAGMVLGGRYELVGQVGNGGYCEVWHATDTLLSRPVAVKLLHPGYTGKAATLARFRAEARHAGALAHPNIARVYDYGEPADGQPPYLVMELVDGPSLDEVLASGPLGARQSMDVIAQAAAGLQAAHEAGLIHRDVKPANLLLAYGGIVKITDFGIAHVVGSAAVTPSGEMMGTPGYHAPEQVVGARATSASDLYALGVVAYECLAGAPPFTGSALMMAVAHRDCPLPPLPPSVPADVSALVADLTAKDPARRPASAAEVALRAALLRDGQQAAAGGGPHPAPEAQAEALVITAPGERPRRRRPSLALAATVLTGLASLVLAALIGFAPSWHAARVPSSPPSAPPPGTGTPARTAGGQATIPDTPATPVTPAAQPRAPAGQAAVSSAPAPARPGHSPAHGRGHGRGNDNGNGQGNGNG